VQDELQNMLVSKIKKINKKIYKTGPGWLSEIGSLII
jgi:hypothetical protein